MCRVCNTSAGTNAARQARVLAPQWSQVTGQLSVLSRDTILELEPERHLRHPRQVLRRGSEDPACRARRIDARTRLSQIRVIEQVEGFAAELDFDPLSEAEFLESREIRLREARPNKRVPAE